LSSEAPWKIGEELILNTHFGKARLGKVLDVYMGDEKFKIEWGDKPLYPWIFPSVEEEKKLFWWRSDAHYPLIYTPLHEDIHTCWDQPYLFNPGRTAIWMFDRYWSPTGLVWVVRRVGARLYEAIVPPPDEEVEFRRKFYDKVMSVYGKKAVEIWDRLRKWSIENLKYLDSVIEKADQMSLEELFIAFQDALDIYELHFRWHWYVNLAYYAFLIGFEEKVKEYLGGKVDPSVIANLSISLYDANWDRLRNIYELKEFIKSHPELDSLFRSPKTAQEILEECEKTDVGKEFLRRVKEFLKVYGWTSPYVHQLQVESWYENPAIFIDELRYYLLTDFNYEKAWQDARSRRDKAVEEFKKAVETAGLSEEKKKELLSMMEDVVRLASVNPDHHFYYDQGTQTRVGCIIRYIGKKLYQMGLLERPDDVWYLRYNELKALVGDPKAFDAKKIAKERREKLEKEYRETPYMLWFGTATEWAIDVEFWRKYWGWDRERLEKAKILREIIMGIRPPPKVIKGYGTGTPIAEGRAKIVLTPEDFKKLEPGDIAVTIMTSPAWVSVMPRIAGLVTDSGSPAAHPAIISRIWNKACVVGTVIATQVIKDGMKIRVNGTDGTVEILEG